MQVSCRKGISQVSWTMLTFPVSQKTWIPRGKIKMVVNLLRKLSMSILWNTWGNQWKNYWGITPAEGYFHNIQSFSGLWCSKGYTPPPNSRTGYENLRDTPIIYRATLGYAARQGIPPLPLLSILEQDINIWRTLLLYIGLYWVIPPVPRPPNSRTGHENLAKGFS